MIMYHWIFILILQLVEEKFKIPVTMSQMKKWLSKKGLTPPFHTLGMLNQLSFPPSTPHLPHHSTQITNLNELTSQSINPNGEGLNILSTPRNLDKPRPLDFMFV